MAAVHAAPGRRWTVDDLAAQTGVSRSRLDARFREVLGRSPIRYFNEWRMHVAQDPAGHYGHHGRGDRPQSGIRRGRGVQPSVQTRARPIPRLMAHSSSGQVRTLAMCCKCVSGRALIASADHPSPAGRGACSLQAVLVRVGGGGGAAGQSQLGEDVADVGGHGFLADDEMFGDLTVGEPLGDVGQDFFLAAGQTAGRRGCEVPTRGPAGGLDPRQLRTERFACQDRLIQFMAGPGCDSLGLPIERVGEVRHIAA
jgi:hypothetical protein